MEVLSDILRSMRVHGSVYFCDQLQAPWTKTFENASAASFHLVRRGQCRVIWDGGRERLGPGDLLFVEPGLDHVLASHLPDEPPPEGDDTLLLCGYCEFAPESGTPLLAVFPKLIVVRDEELLRHRWLKTTLDQLSAEYLSQQPGSELVVDKLTEVLLVELIRIDFGRSEQSRFNMALGDKQIASALKHLHAEPAFAWTLENLGEEIGMSRAALARRFKHLVGQTLFEYLTRLRVQRAKELLLTTKLPVAEIAARVGYESDLAFVKTFKKHAGLTPTRYRKQDAA